MHDPKEQPLNEEEIKLFWALIREKVSNSVGSINFLKIYFLPFRHISNFFDPAANGTDNNSTNSHGENNRTFLFSKELIFKGCHFQRASFSNALFGQTVLFENCNFYDMAEIRQATFKQDISFFGCCFQQLYFSSIQSGGELVIGSDCEEEGTTNGALSFFKTQFQNGVVVGNMALKSLSIARISSCSFFINKITFCEQGLLEILDGDMSNSVFSRIDLTKAKVSLFAARFVGATLLLIKWPKKIEADREMFNQLKHAYDQNANYFEANRFYAEELDAYRKEGISPKEKLVFYISDVVSSHGQDWIRAVGIYGLLGLFFFVPFFLPSKTAADPIGFFAFWSALIGGYFDFISPIKVSPPEGYSLSWWAVYKSLSAVVLYHLVISFRRLTRR